MKAEFKQTEVGVIPTDWDVEPLSACSKTSSGSTPARAAAERYFHGGTIPWVKTLDLNNSVLDETDERVTEAALRETSLRLYPAGSVLVAMYGGFAQIGRTGFLPFPATINQALTAICPNRRKLESRYLLYFLNHHVDYWKSVASSSRKDPNITGNDVRNFRIALPSIEEQRAIAAALSDVDALLEGLAGLIAKKRALKQATMQQLLSGRTRLPGFSGEWEVKPFEQVLTRLNTKSHQIQATEYVATGRYPVVDQGKQLVAGFSDQEGKKLCCPDGGVIVFGDHTCIVKYVDFDFLVGADGTQILRGGPDQNTHFHALQLQYRGITSTGYNRHFKFLVEREFFAPSLREQTAIAAILSDMDAELAALEAQLTKTRALKQAMMQELLTGKTRLLTPEVINA